MLTYSFNEIGSDSLYQHLYKCIKNDISTGIIPPGSKLPSKRNFAKNLNLSTVTIENAYAQLQAEGYIYSVPKKGFFVNDISNNITFSPTLSPSNFKTADTPVYLADFVSNQTNPDNFPFSIWAKLMRETITEEYSGLMKPSPCGGIIELRTAICDHLRQFRNMEIQPEQIIIGAGTEYLYSLIIQLLGHDKIYAVENPGYKKLTQIYKSNHVKCQYVSIDSDGISISSLEETEADIIHISPAHHYPTGIVTPIGRRYELLGWASKSDSRYIIEDDFDSEFRMTGKPIPMLQSIDVSEKVIYMNTFSKSLTSTIRVSYMVLPMHLAEKYYDKLGFYSCTVSTFEQYTLARFIREGYFEKHINRMRTHYKNLRDALLTAIKNSPLSSKVTISEEDSGLHFLMHVNSSLSDEKIVKNAECAGIRISCLSQYYFNDITESTHTIIMNYSGINGDFLPEIISQLALIIRQ